MSQISIAQLFEDKKEKLKLSWVAGHKGDNKLLTDESVLNIDKEAIGYLNFIQPDWIQVLNSDGINYLNRLDAQTLEKKTDQLIQSSMVCIIIADSAEAPESILALSNNANIPLLSSPYPSSEIIWVIRSYLSSLLAPSCELHGVLLDVLGMGVLITGESGVGKSELALELISRGHGLVADDIVELRRIAPETLEGRCPPMLRDYLEVRGLGILNIRTIFGETAVRRRKNMKLIVHLQNGVSGDTGIQERLPLSNFNQTIMSVDIRKVIIPVAAGRNLAVLVEAAVRNYVLQLRGIDSTKDFIERQEREMGIGDEDRNDKK